MLVALSDLCVELSSQVFVEVAKSELVQTFQACLHGKPGDLAVWAIFSEDKDDVLIQRARSLHHTCGLSDNQAKNEGTFCLTIYANLILRAAHWFSQLL